MVEASVEIQPTTMGRSQVQRNKIHGRPGQKGRGRGASRDSGSAGRRRGTDTSKLGDNSFRFAERTVHHNDFDGLLDEINYSEHATLEVEDDDIFDSRDTHNDDSESYLLVDIAGLARCLEQLPIAERLNIPVHVGQHLEERYGGPRKKMLAELREEAKVQSVSGTVAGEVSDNSSSLSEKVPAQHTEEQTQTNEATYAVDDNEEDLEAWLDDMIS
jgi:hypothetical protein